MMRWDRRRTKTPYITVARAAEQINWTRALFDRLITAADTAGIVLTHRQTSGTTKSMLTKSGVPVFHAGRPFPFALPQTVTIRGLKAESGKAPHASPNPEIIPAVSVVWE